jgi:hypothetical protein
MLLLVEYPTGSDAKLYYEALNFVVPEVGEKTNNSSTVI